MKTKVESVNLSIIKKNFWPRVPCSCFLDNNYEKNLDENIEMHYGSKEEADYDEDESDLECDEEQKSGGVNSICVVGETGRRRRKYSCPYCQVVIRNKGAYNNHLSQKHRNARQSGNLFP